MENDDIIRSTFFFAGIIRRIANTSFRLTGRVNLCQHYGFALLVSRFIPWAGTHGIMGIQLNTHIFLA
jgi:hypothetical protein